MIFLKILLAGRITTCDEGQIIWLPVYEWTGLLEGHNYINVTLSYLRSKEITSIHKSCIPHSTDLQLKTSLHSDVAW